jgi:hypothetical protein
LAAFGIRNIKKTIFCIKPKFLYSVVNSFGSRDACFSFCSGGANTKTTVGMLAQAEQTPKQPKNFLLTWSKNQNKDLNACSS